jgi:hypothetical protein
MILGKRCANTECNGRCLREALEWKGNDAKIGKDFLE